MNRHLHFLVAVVAAIPLLATATAAVSLSAVPTVVGIQDPIPDTPAGRRLVEVVEVVNRSDPEEIRDYVSESLAGRMADLPVDDHVRIWGRIAADMGTLEILEVRASEAEAIRARLRTASGEPRELRLRVEPEPPHRIVGLGLTVPSPADDVARGAVPDRPLADAEIADSLGAYLGRLVDAEAFSGVVLVTGDDGDVVFHEAYGEADKSWGIENRKDTKLNLGSMNKMFTAVAIGQLVDRDLLSWEDPIGTWLGDEWVRPEVGEAVQVRHLLSHTSGLGSYFGAEFAEASRRRFKTVDDFAPLVRDETLGFQPGSDWAYSNTGFLLLGAIVEAVTGESYHDYVRDHVFEPAGMMDTGSYDLEYPVENLARGYDPERREDDVRYRNTMFQHVIRGGPAGGGYSTASDLLAFARALIEDRLTSPETTRILTTPKPELGSPGYGYGFGIEDDGRVFGHTGGFPGISSALEIERASGRVTVVLSNYSGGSFPVMEKIGALLDAGS